MIVSITMTGAAEAVIGDCIRSIVHHVDRCVVLDTRPTFPDDDSLTVAQDVAGDKLHVRRWRWRDDYAAARNAALEAARELGATWAIMLDTDERFIVDDACDLRRELEAATSDVLYLRDEGRTYVRERCFRLPNKGRFVGPTHEAFVGGDVRSYRVLEGARVSELAKTDAQLEAKFRRDVEVLEAYTKAHPKDPRWWFYLGESYRNLKEYELAIHAYGRVSWLDGWDEEAAWSCYQRAICFAELDRLHEAIAECSRGHIHHAGIAELAWFAGVLSFRIGKYEQALRWAYLATLNDHESRAAKQRIGFRHRPALYEGPYDVMRWAWRALGDEDRAKTNDEACAAMMARRELET